MFHLHFSPLRISSTRRKERNMPATCCRDSASVKATPGNGRVRDNIHPLLQTHHTHTHIYRECKVIQRHVVRAANPLQLAVVPVLDSRVRDALTEPVFDKSA